MSVRDEVDAEEARDPFDVLGGVGDGPRLIGTLGAGRAGADTGGGKEKVVVGEGKVIGKCGDCGEREASSAMKGEANGWGWRESSVGVKAIEAEVWSATACAILEADERLRPPLSTQPVLFAAPTRGPRPGQLRRRLSGTHLARTALGRPQQPRAATKHDRRTVTAHPLPRAPRALLCTGRA
jgi:hypothetical protein